MHVGRSTNKYCKIADDLIHEYNGGYKIQTGVIQYALGGVTVSTGLDLLKTYKFKDGAEKNARRLLNFLARISKYKPNAGRRELYQAVIDILNCVDGIDKNRLEKILITKTIPMNYKTGTKEMWVRAIDDDYNYKKASRLHIYMIWLKYNEEKRRKK